MRRGLRGVLVLLALAVAVPAAGLVWAHVAIRRLAPPLPAPEAVLALADDPDLPVALWVIETARQVLPRSQMLDPARDPQPGGSHVLTHPAFVLQWADGRILLVDVGMTGAAAREMGRLLEWVGAEPVEPAASTAARLGPAVHRVEGVLFTHLHQDHTQGAEALCEARREPIPWFQTPGQAVETNYTTRAGRSQLRRAGCLEARRLPDVPLARVPGFGGLGVVHGAGHTPGSQLIFAAVRSGPTPRLTVLSGDVANHATGIRQDLPKPLLYRLLITPESETQLGRLRRFLRDLERNAQVRLVVSHHLGGLAAPGLPPFPGSGLEAGSGDEAAGRAGAAGPRPLGGLRFASRPAD